MFFVDPLEGAEQSRVIAASTFLQSEVDAIACDRCQHSMREKWDALPVVSRRQRWMLHRMLTLYCELVCLSMPSEAPGCDTR